MKQAAKIKVIEGGQEPRKGAPQREQK